MKILTAIALALIVAGCQSAKLIRDLPAYW